jgi:hypothetical protein
VKKLALLTLTLLISRLFLPVQTQATTFVVADGDIAGPDGFIAAINKANNESLFPGPDTISLASNGTYVFTQPHQTSPAPITLPTIHTNITVEGNGSTFKLAPGSPKWVVFWTYPGSNLTLNNATHEGTGTVINTSSLIVNNSTFINQGTATSRGIENFGGSATVTNSAFIDSNLGGIYSQDTTLTITNTTFTGTKWGAINSTRGTTLITGSTITNNSISNAIYVAGGTLDIVNSSISGTVSNTNWGGAIYAAGTPYTKITGSTITNNKNNYIPGFLDAGGGLLYESEGPLTITESVISNNLAALGGGVRINCQTCIATISGSTVQSNTGNVGGGVLNSSKGNIAVTNSLFKDNISLTTGGGFGSYGGTVAFTDTSFINNTATATGGAVGLANAPGFVQTMSAQNSCFVGNSDNSVESNTISPAGHSMNFANNWWGSSDGPAVGGIGLGDSVGPNVSYLPFLTAQPVGCPGLTPPNLYNFAGFFNPVDNLPALNEIKAGRSVPLKFSLNGDQGLSIFMSGYPKSEAIACDSTAPVNGIEETLTNPSGLAYDPLTDQYTYMWKTESAWEGTCRQFVIQLSDGAYQRLNFKFK